MSFDRDQGWHDGLPLPRVLGQPSPTTAPLQRGANSRAISLTWRLSGGCALGCESTSAVGELGETGKILHSERKPCEKEVGACRRTSVEPEMRARGHSKRMATVQVPAKFDWLKARN